MSILQHAQDADARMPWLQKQLCWWRGRVQRAKAAMGGSDATGLLDKLQPHV